MTEPNGTELSCVARQQGEQAQNAASKNAVMLSGVETSPIAAFLQSCSIRCSIALEERPQLEIFRLHFVTLKMTALLDAALHANRPAAEDLITSPIPYPNAIYDQL